MLGFILGANFAQGLRFTQDFGFLQGFGFVQDLGFDQDLTFAQDLSLFILRLRGFREIGMEFPISFLDGPEAFGVQR